MRRRNAITKLKEGTAVMVPGCSEEDLDRTSSKFKENLGNKIKSPRHIFGIKIHTTH